MNRCKKDGPPARLSFLPAWTAFVLLVSAVSVAARQDFAEAALGLDPARDLGVTSWDQRATWPDRAPFPGFEPSMEPGLSLGAIHEDILTRKGSGTEFSAQETGVATGFRVDPLPGLSLQAALGRSRQVRRLGDTALVLNQGSTGWDGRLVAAFPLSPAFIPSAGLAFDSESDRENALVGIGLRGRAGRGLEWALVTGRRSLDLPLSLDLPEYKPMQVPFQLRQDFHGLCVTARRGPAELGWTGRLLIARRPRAQGISHALSDSGSVSEQALRLAFGGKTGGKVGGDGWPWRLDGTLESGSGRHHFRGRIEDGEGRYSFGYLEALQRTLSARGEGRLDFTAWRASAFAGTSALEWNGYRPVSVAGKVFWERNAVLDSYEGSLLGVFNRETWLFDGDLQVFRLEAGGALDRLAGGPPRFGRFGGRLGLGWQRVELSARSHITKRTDIGILARSVEEVKHTPPKVIADLVTPDLRIDLDLSRRLGLSARASQAIPVRIDQADGGNGSSGKPGDQGAAWSGGTRISLEAKLRLP